MLGTGFIDHFVCARLDFARRIPTLGWVAKFGYVFGFVVHHRTAGIHDFGDEVLESNELSLWCRVVAEKDDFCSHTGCQDDSLLGFKLFSPGPVMVESQECLVRLGKSADESLSKTSRHDNWAYSSRSKPLLCAQLRFFFQRLLDHGELNRGAWTMSLRYLGYAVNL